MKQENSLAGEKNILSFFLQFLMSYGFTIFVLCLLNLAFGNAGKDVSSIFQLGSRGLGTKTLLQFALAVFLDVSASYFFTSYRLFPHLKRTARLLCIITVCFALNGFFAFLFSWFPVNKPLYWLIYLLCFAACFAVSLAIFHYHFRREDEALQQALDRYKEEHS